MVTVMTEWEDTGGREKETVKWKMVFSAATGVTGGAVGSRDLCTEPKERLPSAGGSRRD